MSEAKSSIPKLSEEERQKLNSIQEQLSASEEFLKRLAHVWVHPPKNLAEAAVGQIEETKKALREISQTH